MCGNGGIDRVLGTLTCSPSSAFGPAAVYGFPVTSAVSELFTLRGAGAPDGTTTQWLIPNLDAATAYTNLYSRTAAPDAGNNRGVREETNGGYLQFDAKGEIWGCEYALNAGMRYVQHGPDILWPISAIRDRSSATMRTGCLRSTWRSIQPRDFIIRGAIAKVMTRPSLGNLTPGGSADGFNYRMTTAIRSSMPFRATNFDVAFEWYFAPQSIFSVALFKKDVASFPVATSAGHLHRDRLVAIGASAVARRPR